MDNETIAAWRAAGERGDAAAAGRCLSPDVEMISPLTAAFRFRGQQVLFVVKSQRTMAVPGRTRSRRRSCCAWTAPA